MKMRFKESVFPQARVSAAEKALYLTGIAFAFAALVPFLWIDLWRVGGIPGVNAVAAGLCVIAGGLALIKLRIWPQLAVFLGAYLYMAARGLGHYDDPLWTFRLYQMDLLYSGMLLCGMAFCRLLPSHVRDNFAISSFKITTVGLACVTLAINLGVLPSISSQRQLDPSQYQVQHWSLVALAFLAVKARTRIEFLWMLGALVSSAVFMIASGTRSSFVLFVLSCFWVGWVRLRGPRKIALIWLILTLGVVLGLFGTTRLLSNMGELGHRLATEDARNDSRWTELDAVIDQLKDDVILGKGFGVAFRSPVVTSDSGFEDFGLAPHIGIVTYFFKGGLLTGVLFVGIIAAAVIKGAFSKKPESLAAAGGISIYFASSLISGGYGLVSLFLLGFTVAYADAPKHGSLQGARQRAPV